MFWRLLIAFLAFGVSTAILSAAVVLHLYTDGWYPTIFSESPSIIVVVGLLAIAPAWVVAKSMAKPWNEIREGVIRIAEGDYQHRVHGGSWREGRVLARGFNEMTEQLASQFQQLREDERKLRAILGGMTEGVIAIGQNLKVLFANDTAGKMLQFDAKHIVDRPLHVASRIPAIRQLLEKSMQTGQNGREEIEVPNGTTPKTLRLSVTLLPESTGAILVFEDISELRRLEQLRQEFVANVSHELKTPLAVIGTCTENLLDGAVEDPRMRDVFLNSINEQSERLHALILDLLSLGRIESGDQHLELGTIQLGEFIPACLETQVITAESKGSKLEFVPKGERVSVWADEEALETILLNLVDNAIKYCQAGATVQVIWTNIGEQTEIRIKDNGPGIPLRDQARIFERFYRVDKARSRELGGTGLGLSIVKQLVKAMSGYIRVESELEKGSEFIVTLPRLK